MYDIHYNADINSGTSDSKVCQAQFENLLNTIPAQTKAHLKNDKIIKHKEYY